MSVRCHILILTPDQRRRDRHRDVLEKAGHTTAPARVLQDALTRVAEQSPDVVLMDLWVEDAPAPLIMKAIEKLAPHTQFVALQIDATQDRYARDAVTAGAFVSLLMNCDEALFVAMIERAAAFRQMKSDLVDVQERLALLFNTVDSGILIVEQDTRQVVDANPAAIAICGRSKDGLVGLVVGAPDAGLPEVKTLATIALGGRTLLLQGITEAASSARYAELKATASAVEDLLFEGSSDGCFTIMPDGSIDTIIHGGTLPSVRLKSGRVAVELFGVDAREDFNHALHSVFSGGDEQRVFVPATTGPSQELRLVPVKLHDQTARIVLHCREVDTDIDESQRVRLRDLATDEMASGLLVVSSTGRVVDASRRLSDRLGYARYAILEQDFWHIDRDLTPEAWPDEWRRICAAQQVSRDGTLLDAKERPLDVTMAMNVLDVNEETFVVVITEETARLRDANDAVDDTRAQEQVVLNLIQDSVIVLDRSGTIKEANDAACRWLRRDRERLMGKHYFGLLSADVSKSRKARIEGVFIQGSTVAFEDSDEDHSYEHHVLPVRNHANVLSDIIFVSRRIWQPSEAVPLGERQDCDYSLEIDHRAKQLAADLLADRAGAALDRACELSAAIATQADGGEGISVDEIALLAQSLEGARAGVVQTLDELRSGSPAQPGLMAAMSALAEDCQKHWGVSCVCHFGAVGIDVDATQMRHLCALARDAVEYAVHRRHATNIRIAVKMSNQELRLDISDDAVEGPSFADSGAIMALINRRAAEMGGSVTLEPSSSGGQILSCAISLSSS